MAVNNAYNQYNRNKVLTASPAELTLMLYDGAIKFCNIALIGIEQKDVVKTYENLVKAQDIINELRSTLNYKYAVAKDFENIYRYIFDLLVEANIKKDKESVDKALVEIRDMRDIWKQIMEKNKTGQ